MAAVIAAQVVEETKTTTTKKQASKDLQKTRLCVYNLGGKCGFGATCSFAHNASEIRGVPDLAKTQLCTKFMEGKCSDKHCSYAHGKEELRDTPNFKKKMCKWAAKGMCRNGAKCGFAHHSSEVREAAAAAVEPPPGFELPAKHIGPPPGLEEMDWETSSTEAPPSQASKESAASQSQVDAPLFHLAAARGAAPLKQQVKIMSSAVSALQAKLSMLEDMVLQSQVAAMQQQISELNQQCWNLEAGLFPEQQPVTWPQEVATKSSRLSAKAAPFVPFAPASDLASDDSTSVGEASDSN